MSDVKLNKPYKQRFKGIEHFLRRVAFNLGNTPSQTEVKIISCIPIDVSDLQAKIQFLERQLQETVRHHSKSSKAKPSTQVAPPLGPFEPLKSGSESERGATAKRSGANDSAVGDKSGAVGDKSGAVGDKSGVVGDKSGVGGDKSGVVGDKSGVGGDKSGVVGDKSGVGGDKSGVVGDKSGVGGDKSGVVGDKSGVVGDKSGVGGDKSGVVGDKSGAVGEKDGATGDKSSKINTGGTVVNTILYGGSYADQSKTVGYSSDRSLRIDRSRCKPSHSGSGASRHRKSNVSFVLPATIDKEEHPYCSTSSHENADPDNAVRNIAEAERKLAAAERYYSNLFKKPKRKKKVYRGKSKLKTHLVYFAQHTENNPFNTYSSLDPFESLDANTVSMGHAYLDNVMRKQYDPKFVIQEFSDTSHFTRPVCRDTSENFAPSRLYESDVCSCCHGRFQNIDNYMPKGFDFINKITQCEPNYANKTYYDSNHYDVVPVKEITNKFLKEGNLPKRNVEIKCWPEQFRSKYRSDPKTVKNQAESKIKRRDNLPVQTIKQQGKLEQCNVEQKRINKQVHEASKITPTKRYSIDYSEINKNDSFSTAKVKKTEPVKTIVLKNESIETDDLNTNLLLNNQSTQLELIPNDNKTESTLNQIKSILQSVLAEVKTNSKVNGSMEKTEKKDAVVQKGASQNNMQGQSTLLHSFTYNNSYNANPYLPSCSQQLSAGQYCLAGVPPYQPSLKYLQNFPVFVHPSSGRRLCACYYKSSSHKSSKHKQAFAAATNTDREKAGEIEKNAGNNETEKLIKEIYKSMAVTMDFPTKENSVSEYDDVKSTKNNFINESNIKAVRSAGTVVDKRDIEAGTLISSNVSSNSKLLYNTASAQPKDAARRIEAHYYDKPKSKEPNHDKILHRFEQHSTETIIEDDEETDDSSDATEEEGIVDIREFETPPKNERKGLLKRMFNTVKMFKKRKIGQQIENENEVSEASDSDDYETIYSGRTAVLRPKYRRQNNRHQSNSKIKSTEQNACNRPLHEKGRRSPYLEQEYRRQWNERIMFDKQQERKYSSERPFSKQAPLKDSRPVYWNNYEARSVLVDNKPSPLKYVKSTAQISENSLHTLDEIKDGAAKYKPGWFKKHKLANCGEQWKKFILEN